MERLTAHTTPGLDSRTMRNWGTLFLAAGLLGRGILQNYVLGFRIMTMEQMLEQMTGSEQTMILATAALVLQALETCAVPVFAMLLVDGAQHTRNRLRYLGRVAALAAACEIPYDLALYGSVWSWERQNPVFGVALSLFVLWVYCRYSAPGFGHVLLKAAVTLGAVLWGKILSIDHAMALVLVTAVLWLMRRRPAYRCFLGMAVAVMCTAFSPFYLAAPMGFLAVYPYNGNREEGRTHKQYLYYPLMLALTAGAGILLKKFL